VTRDDEINILAAEIRKRRKQCPILLSVQVMSAVMATGMTQDDVDEAFRRADEADDKSVGLVPLGHDEPSVAVVDQVDGRATL